MRTKGERRARGRAVWAGSAGVVGAVGILVLMALPALAGVSLTPSNWTGGCTGQATGKQLNANSGSYDVDYSTPDNTNGFSSALVTTESVYGGTGSGTQSSDVITSQHFDLGASSTGGCYNPGTSHSITATFTWTVNAAGVIDSSCGSSGTVSASISVDLYANLHDNGFPYYMDATMGHSNIPAMTNSVGPTTCAGVGPNPYVEVTTGGAQSYTVSVTGSVSTTLTYDFYSSVTVTEETSASAAGGAASVFENQTAQLTAISCPLC